MYRIFVLNVLNLSIELYILEVELYTGVRQSEDLYLGD